MLNPFFTLPCETAFMFNNKECRFYISEESYNCISAAQEYDTNVRTVFKFGLPEYKNISGLSIFFNSLLLFIEIYIISAIFIYLKNMFKQKLSHRAKEAIEITGVIVMILLIIFAVLYYIYLWRLL
jgi:hypothetical protein